MRFLSKRRLVISTAALVAAVAAFGARAYVTANGSGSATATVGTISPLALHGSAVGRLYPGRMVSISFTVDNPSTGAQQLGTIYLASVKACTGEDSSWEPSLNSGAGGCSDSGIEQTGCESVDPGNAGDANARNFYMTDVTENQAIAGNGSSVAATNGGTLKMNNLSSSQDNCKNANLYLQLATR
jgi:hypothetical protein